MSEFQAVFVRVDGLNEKEIRFCPLSAGTEYDASVEAQNMSAPTGANFIKILADGQKVRRIGIAL
jgi:hypothetical protein